MLLLFFLFFFVFFLIISFRFNFSYSLFLSVLTQFSRSLVVEFLLRSVGSDTLFSGIGISFACFFFYRFVSHSLSFLNIYIFSFVILVQIKRIPTSSSASVDR